MHYIPGTEESSEILTANMEKKKKKDRKNSEQKKK